MSSSAHARRILLLHQNFPGQFKRLAQVWAKEPGWDVRGLGRHGAPGVEGVHWQAYQLHRTASSGQHPYLRNMENAVLHGQAVARALMALKAGGWRPDAILAHPGWGETLFVRDLFPKARLVHFCEWYYGSENDDTHFDPEFRPRFDTLARLRTWNALHVLNLEQCDAGASPTAWQRSRHPAVYQSKIVLAHEGIDTGALLPDPATRIRLPSGTVLKAGDPVLTFVARSLEPYRGFHVFMRALPAIQRLHPTCHTIIVGGDGVSYGRKPADAKSWREKLLREVSIDPARTHFVGRLPYAQYRKVLQVSAAHVYLTYPFVLSWSMLEAMSCGCLIIGSRTAPVEEVITDGRNGLLVDFFDAERLANQVALALEHPERFRLIRARAREVVRGRYGLAAGEAAYRKLMFPD